MTLVATTFDPNNQSNFTLSGGSLVATITSGTGNVCATRCCPGLTYFEINTSSSYTGTPRVGITQPGNTLGNNLGADNYSVGYDTGGNVYINAAVVATLAAWAPGVNIGVAIDTTNQTIYFRVTGGNWNNSAANNPATNTGGISLKTMAGTTYKPAVGAGASAAFTAAFLSTSWTYAAPSGFAAISSIAPVAQDMTSALGFAKTSTVPGASQSKTINPTKMGSRCFTPGNSGSPLGAAVSVSGTVQQLGAPAALSVMVFDQRAGDLLALTTSDASTGNFSALCLARNKVFVVAFDPTTYQAQVFDQIVPA